MTPSVPVSEPESNSVTLEVQSIDFKGLGRISFQNRQVVVSNAIPGDIVEFQLHRKNRKKVVPKSVRLIQKSPLRKDPICPHFPKCGGCGWNDVPYATQLQLKEQILADNIQKFFPNTDFLPIIPSQNTVYYRNKMEFSFGKIQDNVILGLKERGKFDHIVPITDCYLLSALSNNILLSTSNFFTKAGSTVWDPHLFTGFLRYLIIRHSKSTDTYMVNLVVSDRDENLVNAYSDQLRTEFPSVRSIWVTIQRSQSDTAFSQEVYHVWGDTALTEQLGDFRFLISPFSFFQTNTHQAQVLYQKILSYCQLKPDSLVFDLYCGTGTIGIFVSPHVRQVIGIEILDQAIQNAIQNAALNQRDNISFIVSKTKNFLKFTELKPDIVIVDPPRSGMVPKALARVIQLQASQLIYVSCNPTTLMKDLQLITQSGYTVSAIQPVDMFPNTHHLETIVQLIRK